MDLTAPGVLKQLADQIKNDIDEWCAKTFDEGPRSHLGASQIGHPCKRNLWYLFRWIKHKTHTGRQYRLFQRGHFEEPRFKSYLEGIGCEVQEYAKTLWYHPESESYFIDDINMPMDSADAALCVDIAHDPYHLKRAEESGVKFDKGKAQIRISGCQGHFGGSLDAIIKLPQRYGIENVVFLGEYKTSGTGKKFTNLITNGCELEKYQHFCQQSIYGYKLGLQYGIYIVVNKNDDDLYIEVVPLNWKLGKELEDKANEIIFAGQPPNKISASASHYECNYCDHKNVCWELNKSVDKNCRSCIYSKPVENAEWFCGKYCAIIPKDFIKTGCDEWCSII